MRFEWYEKELRDLAQELAADESLERVELRPPARKVIERVRREGIPLGEAISGTALHPQPARPNERARQQVERGYRVTDSICNLLHRADADLSGSRVEQLEESLFEDWLQP